MGDLLRSLVLAWLLPIVAVAQRFGAIEVTPTLSPRYYQAASPLSPFGKRPAQCNRGYHPCLDIGSVGATSCCADDTYCIVDPSDGSKAACCAIGSVCDSPCPEDQYQCSSPTTLTSPTSTVSTVSACCPRPCTQTSMFLCPSDLGGGCCSYGQQCGSNRQCLRTSTAGPSSVVSEVPAGCTTSQIACPESLGGGCCANTQSCTRVDGSAKCAAATEPPPTESGVTATTRHHGLSTGNKAGIAVGVVFGSALIIGVLTWLYIRRRKSRSEGSGTGSWSGNQPGAVMRVARGNGWRRTDRARTGAEVSEENSDIVSHGGPLRGLTQDYFGPDAEAGPFTAAAHGTAPLSHGASRRSRAVPMAPLSPDDITAAVEIDSLQVPGSTEGRFELYGSDPTPSAELISPLTPQSEVTGPTTPSDQRTSSRVA